MNGGRLALLVTLGAALYVPDAVADEKLHSIDELLFLTDGKKHFVAIHKDVKNHNSGIYYSWDGMSFYRVPHRGAGYNSSTGSRNITFYAPQQLSKSTRGLFGVVEGSNNKWTVLCSDARTSLFPVTGETLKSIRSKGKVLTYYHRYSPVFLARDDSGIYFYVDALSKTFGRGGYRLFVGKRGAMQRHRLTTVIQDDVGSVFISKAGTLVDNRVKKSGSWTAPSNQAIEVYALDTERNSYDIHVTLGIYGDRLGNPCDDM